jgi:nitrite reductase/ring-hydroxylating ferredoxin subunit
VADTDLEARLPLRGRRRGRGHSPRIRPLPRRRRRRARARQRRPRCWTQLRTINEGEPRAIVATDTVEVGGIHLFRYPTDADPAVLLRVSDTDVVAFSQKCTHLGCVVYYEADEHRWHCPCHEGNFEAETGEVISGPPYAAARAHRCRDP